MTEILSYSIHAIPVMAMVVALSVYLPKHYAGYLGIGLAAVGGIIAMVRLIDVGVDFAVGALMDRTRTPIGRYKPWLVAAVPFAMLSMYMLIFAEKGVGEGYLTGWLLLYFSSISVFLLGSVSYAGTLAVTYNDRSKLFAWSQVAGVLGSIAALSAPLAAARLGYTGEAAAFQAMGVYLLVALPIGIGLMAILTPERIAPEIRRERFSLKELWSLVARPTMGRLFFVDLLLAVAQGPSHVLYLFFFVDALGLTLAQANSLLILQVLAGLAGAPAAAWLASRFGKHRALMATAVGFAAAKAFLWIIPNGSLLYAAVGIFALGALSGSFTLLIRAMTADVGDEIRLERGCERMGMLFSIVTTTTKLGGAASVAVTFTALQAFGFNPAQGAVNSPHAILGLELCYLAGPIILILGAVVVLFGYKLDARRHAEIRRALDERDARLRAPVAGVAEGQVAAPAVAKP